MDAVALSKVRLITASGGFSFPATTSVLPRRPRPVVAAAHPASSFRTGVSPVSELVEEEILKGFLKERRLNGDFITKASDIIWQRDLVKLMDSVVDDVPDKQLDDQQGEETDDIGGFLKLSRTHEWVLGDDSDPVNKNVVEKELVNEREKRKKLNLLNYEAAALSYALGVLFRIGIRSEDLGDALERWTKGSGIALSFSRLVILAVIYGLWVLYDRFLTNDSLYFELVLAMMGMFVYKAGALIQVYRDNEDLRFIFPESEEVCSDS